MSAFDELRAWLRTYVDYPERPLDMEIAKALLAALDEVEAVRRRIRCDDDDLCAIRDVTNARRALDEALAEMQKK